MNLQNLRWPAVAATMAVALAALFGGGFVLQSRTVDEPLKMLYSGSPLVESHTWQKQGDRYEIKVMLKDTPDLASAYQSLNEETVKIMKQTPFTIKVEDRRTAVEEQALRRVNLYVQEALATGQFAAMADRMEQEAAKAGMTARLAVDSDRVYVQLHGKEGYLYNVVERQPKGTEAVKRSVEGGWGL